MDIVMDSLTDAFYLLSLPKMTLIDVLEICIIAFALYNIILWVQKTRAWTLLKGIIVLVLCYMVAYFLNALI